jgi:hypothetical protein
MIESQQYSGAELESGDFLCVPGLPSARFKINYVLADPDGSYTIDTDGVVINLPNKDRKVWALKKKDLDV